MREKKRELIEPVGTMPSEAMTARAGRGFDLVDRERWREAVVALSLSAFPGCGHVYVGRFARGVIWSCLFLGLVLPVSFLLFFTWAFSEAALLSVLAGAASVLVLGGLGPAFRALRGPVCGEMATYRSPTVLAAYAGAVALVAAAESGWFLAHHLETVEAASAQLEPIVRRGGGATILLSSFTRPVHGEVILFRSSRGGTLPETTAPGASLGRVLAKPGDSVALNEGRLFVNGLLLDLERTDQRLSLEKAGRALRRRRLLRELFAPRSDLSAARTDGVRLGGEDWSFVLPSGSYLVLPDVDDLKATPAPGAARPPRAVNDRDTGRVRTAWVVERAELLGRRIPW